MVDPPGHYQGYCGPGQDHTDSGPYGGNHQPPGAHLPPAFAGVGQGANHGGDCAQRGPGKSLAGYWEFPGGKIEPHETARQALHREIEEELLCEVEVAEEVCTSEYAYDFGTVRLTTFICHLIAGTPHLTEHTDIRWLNPADMPTLNWAPVDREAVAIIANKQLTLR